MNAARPLPTIRVSFNYVLILQWLDDSDQSTGADLHRFLQRLGGLPSALVVCKSPEDVRNALQTALREVGTRGIPIVHIESHGSDPANADPRETVFGAAAGQWLRWTDLGDWLAPLNAACNYQLLVVGATCFGYSAIAAMKLYEHVAPFAATVGLTTSVDEGSLRDAMKELYRSLRRRVGLVDAVENAQRELRNPGETLKVTSSTLLALRVLRGVYGQFRTPEALQEKANVVLASARQAGLVVPPETVAQTAAHLQHQTYARSKEVWDAWFPAQLQARDPAYQLDWSLVELEL